jgi:hypothetical protein
VAQGGLDRDASPRGPPSAGVTRRQGFRDSPITPESLHHAGPRSRAKFSSTVTSGFANMVCVEAMSQAACNRRRSESNGGHEAGTRGLAGLVGRELRSLTALLVERNGAQKTPCQASWGEATASAFCKVRPACGPGCSATTPRITF